MAPKKSECQIRLEENDGLLQKNMLSADEHARRRLTILGLVPVPQVAPPAPVAQAQAHAETHEDAASRAAREMNAQVRSWIGTKERPILTGELLEVMDRGCDDETLRRELAHLTTSTQTRRVLHRLMLAANGAVPPVLEGVSETHVLARMAARDFLLRLATAFAVSLAVQENEHVDRQELRESFARIVSDDERSKIGVSVLASLARVKTAETAVEKQLGKERGREGGEKKQRTETAKVVAQKIDPKTVQINAPKTNHILKHPEVTCTTCQGKGHSGGCKESHKGSKIVCLRCKGLGHIAKECPSRTVS